MGGSFQAERTGYNCTGMRRNVCIIRASGLILFFVVLCSGILSAQQKIEYYSTRTVSSDPQSLHKFTPDFRDTLSEDTLFQFRASNGTPVSYFRKIQTSVCFDNKCRPLNLIVHWNVTGRYLGIELPPGEYLSKAEHEPFTREEYQHLHRLLGDAYSPLGNVSYNELVPRQPMPLEKIDAVSSPTAKHLLDYIVEGAAFTTYTLWHIVHGSTRDEVSWLTATLLTPELFLRILESHDASDRMWALKHRKLIGGSSVNIRSALLQLVISADYNLAQQAIDAVQVADLNESDFQMDFASSAFKVDYALRKPVLAKLKEAPVLYPEVAQMLAGKLHLLNGALPGVVLELFADHAVYDPEICNLVAALLANANAFIARQAFDFLKDAPIEDKGIRKKLDSFRKKQLTKEKAERNDK